MILLSGRDNKSRSSEENSNRTSQQPYCIFLPVATCTLNKEKNFQGSNCILKITTFTCLHTHRSIKGTGNVSVESIASTGSGHPLWFINYGAIGKRGIVGLLMEMKARLMTWKEQWYLCYFYSRTSHFHCSFYSFVYWNMFFFPLFYLFYTRSCVFIASFK